MPGKPEIKLVGYACETSEWDNKGLKENEEEKLVKLKERWTWLLLINNVLCAWWDWMYFLCHGPSRVLAVYCGSVCFSIWRRLNNTLCPLLLVKDLLHLKAFVGSVPVRIKLRICAQINGRAFFHFFQFLSCPNVKMLPTQATQLTKSDLFLSASTLWPSIW